MIKRIGYLDTIKGFAMLCILAGHAGWEMPDALGRFYFSFHVPLFFIVSGYFFKAHGDRKAFIKKEANALLLPYFLTCVIVICMATVVNLLKDKIILSDVIKWSLASLYGSGTYTLNWPISVTYIGAIWFLPAMFVGRYIMSIVANKKYVWLSIAIVAYAGYATKRLIWLPMSIQSGMTSTLFIYIGMLIKKYDLFEKGRIPVIVRTIMFGIWICCIIYCGRLYMVTNSFHNGLLDILGAVCATFSLVWIFRFLEEQCPNFIIPMQYIGVFSMAILCMHLVELDVFPWNKVYSFLKANDFPLNYITALLLRYILVGTMVMALFYVPGINRVFFPNLRRKVETKGNALQADT